MKHTMEFFKIAKERDGGLSEEEFALLFLVPLLQMAWAHGAISDREKQIIFQSARDYGIEGRHWFNDKLDEWMIYQPSRLFFDQCLEMIRSLLDTMPVQVRNEMRGRLFESCRQVAASAGEKSAMDLNFHVSQEEEELLSTLHEILD